MQLIDRAALIIHESLHPYFRNSPNTQALRQLVAYLTAPRLFRDNNREVIRKVIETETAAPIEEFQK